MMLAQQTLDAVPDSFWKSFCIALLVLLGAVGTLIGIAAYFRKPEATALKDDPAIKVEKTSKRYNHDMINLRFQTLETKVQSHDAQIDTVLSELKDMREKNSERYTDIAVSLAEIKVHLGIKRNPPQSKS